MKGNPIFTAGIVLALGSIVAFFGGIAAAFLGVDVPVEWLAFYFIGMPLGLVLVVVGLVIEAWA